MRNLASGAARSFLVRLRTLFAGVRPSLVAANAAGGHPRRVPESVWVEQTCPGVECKQVLAAAVRQSLGLDRNDPAEDEKQDWVRSYPGNCQV